MPIYKIIFEKEAQKFINKQDRSKRIRLYKAIYRLPMHLQSFYNDLTERGYERNGKHMEYTAGSLKKVHAIISSVMKQAVQWQSIDSNPCLRVSPPKPKSLNENIKYWTVEHQYNARVTPDNALPVIPLHGLRHTSATLLISQHVDVRTVSGRLGHAQASTTMNIYAHSLREADNQAAEALENLFERKAK